MISQATQQAMKERLAQATPPERQLDRHWLQRYRDLVTYDADWWWTAAGPFTEEEQGRWERYRSAPAGEVTQASLTTLMIRSRQRELWAAWAGQRAPRFHYPALPLDDVRARLAALSQLRATIFQEEPDELVGYLYAGAIDEAMQKLRLLEATGEGNTAAFREGNQRLFRAPSPEEMIAAFFRLRRLIQQGLERSDTVALSHWLHHFVEHRLCLILDLSEGKDDPPVVSEQERSEQAVSAQTVKAFFEASLRASGYEGWQVGLDRRVDGFHVHAEKRRILLPATRHTLTEVRRLLAHELAGRVARTFAGEHAPIGLLGIGTQGMRPPKQGSAGIMNAKPWPARDCHVLTRPSGAARSRRVWQAGWLGCRRRSGRCMPFLNTCSCSITVSPSPGKRGLQRNARRGGRLLRAVYTPIGGFLI